MNDEDLIHVLLDRHTLRGQRRIRMVSAWPKVGAVNGREAMLKRWALLAGVPLTEARNLGPLLLEHGICKPGGGVDDTAAAVLSQVIVEALEPRPRSGSKGGKGGSSKPAAEPGGP